MGVRTRPSLILLTACLIAGCGSAFMQPGETRPAAPPEGRALVWFLTPSSGGGKTKIQVWDGESCIGVALRGSCFAHACAPGKHFLMFMGDNDQAIEAELDEGKTYYVVLDVGLGWNGRVDVQPVVPGSAEWDEAPSLAQSLKYLEPQAELLKNYQVGRQDYARQVKTNLRSPANAEQVRQLPSSAGR